MSAPLGSGNEFSTFVAYGVFAALRALSEGTTESTALCGSLKRCASYEKKKNVRLRPLYTFGTHTGPLNVPPKLLYRRRGLGIEFRLLKKSFASILSLRKYSYAEPCGAFTPDLVTSEICAPGDRPNSGAN